MNLQRQMDQSNSVEIPVNEIVAMPPPAGLSVPPETEVVASMVSAPSALSPLPLDEKECVALWRFFVMSILQYCEGFDDGEDYHCAGAIFLARLAVALRRPPSEAATTLEEWHNAITLLLTDIPADVHGPWNTWVKNYNILEGLGEAAREVAANLPRALTDRLRARANTGTIDDNVRSRFEEVMKSTKGPWQTRIQLVRKAGELRGL